MHLLTAQAGGFNDDEGIVDLQQTPADMVILTAADSTLGLLAGVADELAGDYPSIRLANWLHLRRPAALDLYYENVLEKTRLVVLSLLGGSSYWTYGLERLREWAIQPGRSLVVVPGDDAEDPALMETGNVDMAASRRIWRYLREGGETNARNCFHYIARTFFERDLSWHEPRPLPRALLYHPRHGHCGLEDWRRDWQAQRPVALVLLYRSHLQAANTEIFNDLITVLRERQINPLPVAVTSLKEDICLERVNQLIEQSDARIILNTTGFALQSTGNAALASQPSEHYHPFAWDIPVLQLILASNSEADWLNQKAGLRTRDLAMHVALPELDGRIITRAIGFKRNDRYSERCQLNVMRFALRRERAAFTAELAWRWCRLQRLDNGDKRLALILANYPSRDGRIGNGVGLDTPESTINLLEALRREGYPVDSIPPDGDTLIKALQGNVTNSLEHLDALPCSQSMDLASYQRHFRALPPACQEAVTARWGKPERDPKYRAGRLMVAGVRLGETFVGIQPVRGFNIDLTANYHDPDLVPPHSYLAFYFWLRHEYRVDAVVHMGKHGNLEWLPGKGTALSAACWPDVALGPLPHLYPFIVNDPGEGAQAKRRAQAVIIDHLMPPMTRAEIYGDLAELEQMADEYYQALGLDPRREAHLRSSILDKVRASHVLEELALGADAEEDKILKQLDTYLCDIKEAQIRDGLHCLGGVPPVAQLRDTLVALVRLPRGERPEENGFLHTLADDLGLARDDFDPLDPQPTAWLGPRPAALAELETGAWRTQQHTRERLELYARQLVESHVLADIPLPNLPRSARLLDHMKAVLLPALERSAAQEIDHSLSGLAGRFVPPGPSGAPSRGRLDTLPTGRNFYAVDCRAIPSKAAWTLGQASAEQVVRRHLQEHGDYPRQIGLSVWGTATMRTGGDDIAQAFALMGVKPVWAPGSPRVMDFEVIPAFYLGRPRVDVTLRVSGFFRDAFPNVIALFDAAVRKLVQLDESGADNCPRRHAERRAAQLQTQGLDAEEARRQASFRVFGSKPGAYGAGLQGLIDERAWQDDGDLARAYVAWGGYAYGQNLHGEAAFEAFEHRLGQLEAVMHNQDNREHDILDSDDYYQFQGGMANAVRAFGGTAPEIYHNDHSNPARPRTRTLKEELNRVVRARVTNPKWIAAMRRHGYKGAFEMAASVDYLFAYDATSHLVDDYQYENVTEALVLDPQNQQFLCEHNPHALQEMSERLLEAMQRQLWEQPGDYRQHIESLLLGLDGAQEQQA